MPQGIHITFEDEQTAIKATQEATDHLRGLLSLDKVIYSKLVYKTASNLPTAKRGYALFIPSMDDNLHLKIVQVTWEIALIGGYKFNADEPQCLLVQYTQLKNMIKNLSYALYGDNSMLEVQDWI